MKKYFKLTLSALLLASLFLGLSACSKRVEVIDGEKLEIKDQDAIVEDVQISENEPREQSRAISGSIISDLKAGDKIGEYVVEGVKGVLCQENCQTDYDLSGSIYFSGEKIISGKFRYAADYTLKLGFIPDEDSQLPYLRIKKDQNVLELIMSNPYITMMNEAFLQDDFSAIADNLPGFADFIKQKDFEAVSGASDASGVFNKNVAIKIKNYSTNSLPGGEAGSMAQFVQIVGIND